MNHCFFKRVRVVFISCCFFAGLMAGSAFAEDFEAASGGMSKDLQSVGIYVATGTGMEEPDAWANVSVVIDTVGASYLLGDQSVAPHVVLSASEPVDLYVSLIFGDLILNYDVCSFFENPWKTDFTPCFKEDLDLTLFDYSAGLLATVFSGETFIPFGVFVRAVEAGTGVNGNVLSESTALTFITNLPPMPEPAHAPW